MLVEALVAGESTAVNVALLAVLDAVIAGGCAADAVCAHAGLAVCAVVALLAVAALVRAGAAAVHIGFMAILNLVLAGWGVGVGLAAVTKVGKGVALAHASNDFARGRVGLRVGALYTDAMLVACQEGVR